MFNKLLFGTAGIPISTPKHDTVNGIEHVRKLGLDAMELEFVRQVNIKKETAPLVKESAKKNNVVLTCHGQYFINLNSLEKAKIEASKQRILKAARIAWLCGGFSLTFHAAFYMKLEKESVYGAVKKHLDEVVSKLKDEGNKIWVRPETTGKATQFGDVDELIRLSQDIDQVMPCIDFSHLHARSGGKYNTYEEFSEVLTKVENGLGKDGLNNMHIHLAGINYSDKGERNHLNLKESDMNYKDLIKAWKDFKVKGVVISESPNIENDALLVQKEYSK